MADYPQVQKIKSIIDAANKIVIVQADNPDGDSVASSLALEHILGDMGKEIVLYCGVDLPGYLKYLPGSDRVVNSLPSSFDASIVVDTSSDILLEQLDKTRTKSWLASKPCIVIDHHATAPTISFATVMCNVAAVSTGEVIYEIANQLKWEINQEAKKLIAISILSDSMGLTAEATTSRSVHIIAELVEGGISLAEIENARRETMRREPELIAYKGQLLQRVEFHDNNRIAMLSIPWEEIEKYSALYNPPMLVIDDMRLAKNTDIAICFKLYPGGKITAKIRANYGSGIAGQLAEHFGGGGHAYASGFKITDGRPLDELKAETIKITSELLDKKSADK